MENINTIEYIAGGCSLVVSAVSLTLSAITLYLIAKIGRWNGFIMMVTSMTISQIIYDCCFALEFPSTAVFEANIFISTFGGVSVTLWTNVMSGVVVYMVIFLTPVDTRALYPLFFGICVILPLCYAIVSVSLLPYGYLSQLDYSYNIIRLSSICLNFIAYFITARKLGFYTGRGTLPKDHPLMILTSRLKFYPIVQIITRIWPSIYELTYGNALDHASYDTGNISSDAEVVSYAIMLPSAGIGFFFVFLAVQPLASAHWNHICCKRSVHSTEGVYRSSESIDNPLSENDTFRRSVSGTYTNKTPLSRFEMDEDLLVLEIKSERNSSYASKDTPTGGIDFVHEI